MIQVSGLLIDHGDMEIVESACGVLINLFKSKTHVQVFLGLGGADRLIEVLEWALSEENNLLTMACIRTLQNLRSTLLPNVEESLEESLRELQLEDSLKTIFNI